MAGIQTDWPGATLPGISLGDLLYLKSDTLIMGQGVRGTNNKQYSLCYKNSFKFNVFHITVLEIFS